MKISNEQEAPPSTLRSRIRARSLVVGIVFGLVVGAALAVAGLFVFARGSTPLVTEELLREAEARWSARGPQSYDEDLVITGPQAGDIQIEVRAGQVERMVRNGQVPRQRRTWDYWSVPNQFAMIRQDLASARSPLKPFGVTSPGNVVLRADFDPELGYPRFYQRAVLGTQYDISWRAARFAPRD